MKTRPCTNNHSAKMAEITAALEIDVPPLIRLRLQEMFVAGEFRHDYDVALAAIMLDRGKSPDEVSAMLKKDYGPSHRCDPVYPG